MSDEPAAGSRRRIRTAGGARSGRERNLTVAWAPPDTSVGAISGIGPAGEAGHASASTSAPAIASATVLDPFALPAPCIGVQGNPILAVCAPAVIPNTLRLRRHRTEEADEADRSGAAQDRDPVAEGCH